MSSLIKVLNAFILKFLQYRQFSSMLLIRLESRQELLKKIYGFVIFCFIFYGKRDYIRTDKLEIYLVGHELSFIVRGLYNYG